MSELPANLVQGSEVLQEAEILLEKMRFHPGRGDFAQGQYVAILIDPQVEADQTMLVQITCWARGHQTVDWRRLVAWVRYRQEGIERFRLVSLDSRGRGYLRSLPPTQCLIRMGSRGEASIPHPGPLARQSRRGSLATPCAAAAAAAPPDVVSECLHICDSLDGKITATVRRVVDGIEIAFETRAPDMAKRSISFALVASRTGRILLGEEVLLETVPADPESWEGTWRGMVDCDEPSRFLFQVSPAVAEINVPAPAQPQLLSPNPERGRRLRTRPGKDTRPRSDGCVDLPKFHVIISNPPFGTLQDLKVAWQRRVTWAEVRHAWDNTGSKKPWSIPRSEQCDATTADQRLYAETLYHRRLWYQMVHPDVRGFFHACRNTLASGRHAALLSLDEWLEEASSPLEAILDYAGPQRKAQLGRVFRAHLLCTRANLDPAFRLADDTVCEDACAAIHQETGLPLGLVRDLAAELTGCATRSVAHTQSVTVLLVDETTGQGLTVDLVGELVSPGRGELHPAPALALLFRDEKYLEGEELARHYVADALALQGGASDVRWSLRKRLDKLPCEITGDSASGALGFLLACLWAVPPVPAMRGNVVRGRKSWQRGLAEHVLASFGQLRTLAGVAISGRLGPGGCLRRVSREHEKMLVARLDKSLPRIHTVIFAQEQRPDAARGRDEELLPDFQADVRLLLAATLHDAARELAVDMETRWGAIPNYSAVLCHHAGLVGRAELKRRIQSFIEQSDCGYLLLVAGPGAGKSAFVAEMVRQQLYPTVVHFIERGQGDWDRPGVILASLGAQIRRLFALPVLEEERARTPAGAFVAVLNRASGSLAPSQKALVLVDGLDEAFGAGGRFARLPLASVFPRTLPPGIKIMLTSRNGKHLDWLADPRICQRVALRALDQANRDDIEEYLFRQSRSRNLALSPVLIRQLVLAAQGCFAAAVLYLRERTNLGPELQAWERDPSEIPRGLDDWLQAEWTRLLNPVMPGKENSERLADRQRLTPPPRVITAILGVMAAAQEWLSHDHLATFLSHLVRQEAKRPANVSVGASNLEELLRHLDSVWALTEGLMEPQEGQRGTTTRSQFFHPRFREFILGELSQAERRDSHRILARACDGWRCYRGAVRDYALKHQFLHWAEAGQWKSAARVLAAVDFVQERIARFGFSAVRDDAQIATLLPHMPRAWRQAFVQWELFLRPRIERLDQVPTAYIQEISNEFLPTATEQFCGIFGQLHEGGAAQFPVPLHKAFGPPALITAGHTAPVTNIAFSPDGLHLASASQDGTVKVWEVTTGRLVADCLGHQGYATGVAFSPRGEVIASASDDGKLKLYEAFTGRLLTVCTGHEAPVTSLAFAPEGRYLASAGNDGTVKVWDALTGRLAADCRGHRERVNCLAFCPTPQRHLVASASWDGTVKVWRAKSGRLQTNCIGHGDWVTAVCFLPDGRRLASGSRNGTVKIWDTMSGKLQNDCTGHHGWVLGVCSSPDGHWLASASGDRTVKVWEARTGRLVVDCVGHRDEVTGVSFSPDGRWVASGSGDRTVKVWEARTGRLIADCVGHREKISCVAFSSERQWGIVASGSADNTVKIWKAATGQLQADCSGCQDEVANLAFSPEGRYAALTASVGRVSIIEIGTRRLVADQLRHPDDVTSLAFSADGRHLASGSRDGAVRVWETATGRFVADSPKHEGNVTAVTFSSDGRLIASAGVDKTLRISEAATGRLVAVCPEHEMTVTSVVFAPNARHVASASNDKLVRIFEAATGRLVASCHGHQEGIKSLVFSPNGQYLASGGWDAALKVWDAGTGRLKFDCLGHGAWINHAVFSPDGCWLASSSHDATVKLWLPETGRLYATCHGHQGDVNCLRFSPDSRYLVSAGADKTVRLWTFAEPTAHSACCANILFFQHEPVVVAFAAGEPLRLLVGDRVGRIFGYEMKSP
jgi:WD40 repeat protein